MKTKPSILVVDDDQVAAELLSEVLAREGYSVQVATSGKDAIKMSRGAAFDVVITDLRMPDIGGIEVLMTLKKASPQTVIIVITAFGSFQSAIEAIQNGAYDYIIKPFKMEEIRAKVNHALEQKLFVSEKAQRPENNGEDISLGAIVGRSPGMLEIYKTIARVASSNVPVLMQGESGTGKELIAKAIHDNSRRASKPFLAINCAAFPETLLESELFGYMKGAFTNASTEKKGLIEEANGGVFFMDEIGDMPLSLQSKLLRVLQRYEIRRLGGTSDIPVDVRFLAATNKDLAAMVKSGQFREDLYYRLHVVTISLPPLRGRKEDIPLLLDHFFKKAVRRTGKDIRGISSEAMDLLIAYDWPGNIRQLENVIERAVALTNNSVLLPSDVNSDFSPKNDDVSKVVSPKKLRTLEEVKMDYIYEVMKHTEGNQNMAAEILGIDRKTLYRILKRPSRREPDGNTEI